MSRRVSVADMSPSTTYERLTEVCAAYGKVKDTFIKQDLRTGAYLGYGFVDFANAEEAAAAAKALHESELDGKKISAYLAMMG